MTWDVLSLEEKFVYLQISQGLLCRRQEKLFRVILEVRTRNCNLNDHKEKFELDVRKKCNRHLWEETDFHGPDAHLSGCQNSGILHLTGRWTT